MCSCFIGLNMSRNERHRSDKRASSSRARSRGINDLIIIFYTYFNCM